MSYDNLKIQESDISSYGVVSAPDRLSGTAQENKAVFDRLIKTVVAQKFNSFIDYVLSEIEKIEVPPAGEPGYSPVKGVDYWTEEDKAEIESSVIEELSKTITAVKLWENASPSSNFANQTVNVDCSDYRYVRIQFSITPGASSCSWWDIPVGSNGICITGFYPSTGFTVVTRLATVTTTAIIFGKDLGRIFGSSDSSINNTAEYMIPLKIYGIK